MIFKLAFKFFMIASAAFVFVAPEGSVFAQKAQKHVEISVAFIGAQRLGQGNSAVFNGANSVARDISASNPNTPVSVKFYAVCDDSAAQIAALEKAFLGGFSGAVIVPVEASKPLAGKIEVLSKSGFTVAAVGRFADSVGAACAVSTNREITAALLEKIISERSGGKAELFAYFYSEDGDSSKYAAPIAQSNAATRAETALRNADFLRLFPAARSMFQVMRFYGDYADSRKIEIMRRDNFGEVFFSPSLLANMRPIAPDVDRLFAVCVGGLPFLEFYLASGQITDCIYDDFYGWGVFALRGIVGIKSGRGGQVVRVRKIAPVRVSKEKFDVFTRDWRKWSK